MPHFGEQVYARAIALQTRAEARPEFDPNDHAARLRAALIYASQEVGVWFDPVKNKAMMHINGAPIVIPRIRVNGQPPVMKPAVEQVLNAFKAALVEELGEQLPGPTHLAERNMYQGILRVVWHRKQDTRFGGLAERANATHPCELVGSLNLIKETHTMPTSELAETVDAWLAAECTFQQGAAMTHREAVAAFEAFAGADHCRKAFTRLLAFRGLQFAKVRGRRKWFGLAFKDNSEQQANAA